MAHEMTGPQQSPAAVLTGAPAIARYLGMRESQVRHLVEAKRIPVFKLGKSVAARKATLDQWLVDLERQGLST
jgi:excisionase family DNA binding protein